MGYAEIASIVLKLLGGALGLGALGYSLWRIKKSYDSAVESRKELEATREGIEAREREAQEVAKRRGKSEEEEREILGEGG